MRIVRLLLATGTLLASLTPALAPASAIVQQAPAARAPLPCTGDVNIVRISDIKPGMMAKFLQAVTAQQAWYKKAGMSDQIGVMRIMEQDPTTKAYTTSETQAITTHIIPAGSAKGPAHDAGWDAFVAMFGDSSTIKTAYTTCVVPM